MKKIYSYFLLLSLVAFMACGDDDGDQAEPMTEEIESITDVTLTFERRGGGAVVTARANDPDGEGPLSLQVIGDITLQSASDYDLTIAIANNVNPINPTNIARIIGENASDYMFFFGWTDGLFSDPVGNGNFDNRADLVNYDDSDDAGLPIGLETTWSTGTSSFGSFRVVLKNQPDGMKTETSTASDGTSEIDLSWNLSVR